MTWQLWDKRIGGACSWLPLGSTRPTTSCWRAGGEAGEKGQSLYTRQTFGPKSPSGEHHVQIRGILMFYVPVGSFRARSSFGSLALRTRRRRRRRRRRRWWLDCQHSGGSMSLDPPRFGGWVFIWLFGVAREFGDWLRKVHIYQTNVKNIAMMFVNVLAVTVVC